MSGRAARWWRRGRSAGWKLAQAGGRIAAQAPERAWLAGRKLARHIISIQRSAELPEHLMRRSARSVINRERDGRPGDMSWREGYRQIAEARVPGLAPRLRVPEADQEAGQ